VFLGVALDHEKVTVALKLHPDAHVDRENLERKLDDTWEREKLVALLAELPAGTRVGVSGQSDVPAAEVDDARLGELVAELARPEAPGKTHWFSVWRTLPRAEAIAAGPELATRVREVLVALLPLYQAVAWSRDNDFVSMRDKIKQEKQAKRQKGLAKHDKVRIVRGMFSGRSGVIQEIDAKGALRVLVGTVTVKVAADEVEKH
jgi:transcription antitermination factor NusG